MAGGGTFRVCGCISSRHARSDLATQPMPAPCEPVQLLQGCLSNVGVANLPRDYAEPSESRENGAQNYWMLLSIWRELVYK